MSFQSLGYYGFLLLVWAGALLLPQPRIRQAALLGGSYFFYATWSLPFALLLLVVSLFNFLWGRLLQQSPTSRNLWIGLLVDIALLGSFKYANGFIGLIVEGMQETRPDALVPIGISFYTFQAISYLVDVYRGYGERPGLIDFLLYMAFWPYILAGPICRLPEMLPQFRAVSRPAREDVRVGLQRIFAGLFMKIVLADTLATGIRQGEGVVAGFDELATWGTLDVGFLAVGFGFQIFFDFAGYSHIAIGSARLFGIRLRENFNDPYLARTPSDFWNRWHMSLSSWIRDYVFFPLAALQRSMGWRHAALVVSMIVFGIWHGLAATFLVWGIYQGLLLVAQHGGARLLKLNFKSLAPTLKWSVTFLFISLGWLIFRANSLGQTFRMFESLFSPVRKMPGDFYMLVSLIALGYFTYTGVRGALRRMQKDHRVERFIWLVSPVYRTTIILWVIIWSEGTSPFVYVRF